MKKLIFPIMSLLVSIPTFAQTGSVYIDSCRALPEMKKNALKAYYEMGALKDHATQMSEISNDAKNLNYASAGLATASATAGIGLSYAAAAAPIIVQDSFSLLGFVMYMKSGLVLTLGGARIAAIPSTASLVAVSLVSPIDSYFLASGTYHLLTNAGSKVEVGVEELRLKEKELKELIQKDTVAIEELINSEPSKLSNGVKFGSPMRKHFEKIAGLSVRRSQAAETIYNLKSAEVGMLLIACMSQESK